MAIVTLDGALAGMQPGWSFAKDVSPTLVAGRPHSLWYLAGAPGVGLTPATATGTGVPLSSTGGWSSNIAGQLPHNNPGSGNSYLARLTGVATQPGILLLCDRLLHCGAVTANSTIVVTTTTAQTINTATLPARDNVGATSGAGIQCALEIVSATGAGAATPTIGYTGNINGASQTAAVIDPYVASSAAGAFYRFGLAAGDTGIASVQTLTLGVSMTSGAIALVLYRQLAALELVAGGIPNAIDALTAAFPQIFAGTVPFLVFIPSTTTASNICGTYTECQG